MRLGGPVFEDCSDPYAWVAALKNRGYTAAVCPLEDASDPDRVAAFRKAARDMDVVIAEVGAWSNPLSPNKVERQKALDLCRDRLALAEMIGARCCVNIAGSVGETWDGPCPADLTAETFDLIVQTVRGIIDQVQPSRTFYTLETMPWMYPDSPDSYLRLIEAVDREQFAVHLDVVNMVNCPTRYFRNAEFVRECFAKLGPHVKSCHAKDVRLEEGFPLHLKEVRPGLGELDYGALLSEVEKLGLDTPVLLEHLPSDEEYHLAAAYLYKVASELGMTIK